MQTDLYPVADSVSSIEAQTEQLLNLSPVRLWHELRDRREMRWLGVNPHAAFDAYAAEDLTLIEKMVREHFATDPEVSDYAANLAELQGYSLTFSADDEPQPHLEDVACLVSAAIARSQRVPGPFTKEWIAEGIASRRDLISLTADFEARPARRRPPSKPVQREIGILDISPEGARALAEHRRATTDPDSAAIIWRTDQGAILAARAANARTVPVMYRPTWGTDLSRRGKPRTNQLGAEFRKLVESFEGQVTRFEGPGLILGGRAAAPGCTEGT